MLHKRRWKAAGIYLPFYILTLRKYLSKYWGVPPFWPMKGWCLQKWATQYYIWPHILIEHSYSTLKMGMFANKNDYGRISSGHITPFGDSQDKISLFHCGWKTIFFVPSLGGIFLAWLATIQPAFPREVRASTGLINYFITGLLLTVYKSLWWGT